MGKDIHRLRLTISEKRLSKLIETVQKNIDSGNAVDPYCAEELDNFKKQAEYMRMYAFSEKKDPYRQQVFDDMVEGLVRLSRDVIKCERVEKLHELSLMKKQAPESDFDFPSIRRHLEDYVSSMAMAKITRVDKNTIIDRHFKYIERLFDFVITGRQWNESKMNFFSEILSSNVIDAIDAQVIVTAITMSSLFVSDELKIETLLNVYVSSQNTDVKQRAFVGWVLTLHSAGGICSRIQDRVSQLVRKTEVMQDLLELQIQLFYCAAAEKDKVIITRDIMPGIANNSSLKFNRFGIDENDEDDIDNILEESGDLDRSMEELENGIEKIKEMQDKGIDVYFGGFEKMKNFSFFFSIVNWFYPFTDKHPGLNNVKVTIKGGNLLKVIDRFPFCNSDKYSFAMALSSVFQSMPDALKQMLNNEGMLDMSADEPKLTPSYRRRIYLQDLFRFYKINSSSKYIDNPFSEQNGLMRGFFFDDDFLLCDEMVQAKQSLARFFFKKRHDGVELGLLLDSYVSDDVNDMMLRAGYMLQQGEKMGVSKALEIYRKVYAENPQREGALQGIVRCLSSLECYEDACSYCKELVGQNPESKSLQLNYSIILIKCDRTAEANKILFKLHYEHPDDRNVMRVLAWCLLLEDKLEKSVEMFDKILAGGKVTSVDNLNAGFAKWISRKEDEASDYFAKYVKSEDLHSLAHEIDDERELLHKHDIVEADMCMMLDLVEERTKLA